MNKKEKLKIKLEILKKAMENKNNASQILVKEQIGSQEIIDEAIIKTRNSLKK